MAIITKLNSNYDERFKNIPVILQYINSLEDVLMRINTQNSPMVRRDLGQGIFALEQIFETKEIKDCFYESHKKYIDIQIMLEGAEIMQLFDVSNDNVKLMSYDKQTDFCIFEVNNEIVTTLFMTPGDIYVFFPNDGHLGMLKNNVRTVVKKTVIKVPYESFAESISIRW
jgi:biofilm protein TabA